jgi:hypothetical protein
MSKQSADVLKLLTQRLSQLLSSTSAIHETSTSAPPSGRVGIWQADEHSGSFIRSTSLTEEWRHWADVERIPAKGKSKRVVFLGESVARGYFYDPLCTPASMLESMCNISGNDPAIQVVDLARVDLNLKELIPLMMSVPVLEPDAIVLFAGNNWDNVELAPEHFYQLAAALRQGGYPACQQVFNNAIQMPACLTALDTLAAVAKRLSIPVIVAIPEFNLLEWRHEPAVQVPYLKNENTILWFKLRQQTEQAFASEHFDEVIRLATEMIRLDEGTSALSQTFLGLALLRRGEQIQARRAFERARDACCGILISHSPRCPEQVQQILRSKAAEHGFSLVDLPSLFEHYLAGALPDHRLFLDYCHLTIEGTNVAMAAVADLLLKSIKDEELLASNLIDTIKTGLMPIGEARAHFLAAIHNAHYGQGYETIFYHCRKAVEISQAISEDMLCYLDFQPRQAPHWLCSSYNQLCTSAAAQRYLPATDERRTDKLADFVLLSAIQAALQTIGIDVNARLVALQKTEHGQACQAIDLLSYRYHATTFRERKGYSLGPERAYYQEYNTISTFYLIREERAAVTCQLTCRLPGRNTSTASVAVRVNDTQVHLLTIAGTWQMFTFMLPAEVLQEGINTIVLCWPLPVLSAEEIFEQEARKLERGCFPDVLPVFADISSFTAQQLMV